MTFHELDNYAMQMVYIIITVFGVAHLNEINIKTTPIMEAASWWAMTVGAFAIWWLDVHQIDVDWGFTLFGIGAAGVTTIVSQTYWRPWLADRRKTEVEVDRYACDRRCQKIKSLRKEDGPNGFQKPEKSRGN